MGKIAIVTGGNRGLGLALVRGLCQLLGANAAVHLTARDETKGRAAVAQLVAEGLTPKFEQLDIAEPASIEALAAEMKKRHGGIDILIQNAAYAPKPGPTKLEEARLTIDTNNHGTAHMLTAFRPLFRRGARVVVVASGYGTLESLDARLHPLFESVGSEDVERNLESYLASLAKGRAQAEGWPDWVNPVSKIGQVALTRAFARELAADANTPADIIINAACPGWMITDASRPYLDQLDSSIKPKMPDDAAGDVIWLATLPAGTAALYGELVQYRKIIPFATA
ncbi:MAG: SDR family NAD(P)-dependent oxidoreductase [Parvibaculum sp.]